MRQPGLRYMPALDGLRAVAVVAVMRYHGHGSGARGGYFGVDAFFVLSGFLITSLLLDEWRAKGRIDLRAFWTRRARRLLPALALVLVAVAAYAYWGASPLELHQLRRDGISSIFYLANWNQIFSHTSYFEQFASAPSALKHTWSLAIEEQFYLLWPLIVFGVLRARRGSGRALLACTAIAAAGSALLMAVLYHPGHDPSRVYYGTDTRAQSLLIGAVLAMLLADRPSLLERARPKWMLVAISALAAGVFGSMMTTHDARLWLARSLLLGGLVVAARQRRALNALAIVAACGLGLIWTTTQDTAGWQYRGGFLLAAVLVAIVVAGVTNATDTGSLGRVLATQPLRAIGLISYGLYLWHWPVYVYLSPDRTGLGPLPLMTLRIAVTFAIATASFVLVERPVRRGVLRGWPVRVAAPLTATALVFGIVVATAGPLPAEFRSISAADNSPPPALPPPAPRGPHGTPAVHPLRVMLVGDSVAASMAPGLKAAAAARGYAFWDRAVPGCGLASDVGDRWFAEWRAPDPRCSPGWRTRFPLEVAAFHPDVVIALFGGQDAFDRRINGQVTRFDGPDGYTLAARDLQDAANMLDAQGAHVVLLTTPYYKLGWPQKVQVERSPLSEAWINRYNAIQRDVARASRGRISVLDLNRYLDPNGTWTDTVNGVKVRTFDKCHLSTAGAIFVASWLAPQLQHFRPAQTVRVSRT